jgi:type I restriction enzyme S subunit
MKRFAVQENDLIISCSGTFGKVSLIAKDDPKGIISQALLILRPNARIHPEYLKYFFVSPLGFHSLASRSIGSVQVNLARREIIENIPVPLPKKFEEQSAIVKILSDLDAKIELNHQMNKTLESIAQAIFKQWFVDFAFPGYEKTKFENGIPQDWREGNLVDTCEIIMGQSPPGETYNESGDGIAFYQGNRDFGFRYPSTRVYCTAPTRIAEAGDVLISVRAPVGALNITLGQCAIGRGVAALRMKHYSNGFLYYFLLTQNDLWDRYNSEGTVFGCLNKTEFHKMQVIIPSDEIMAQFDGIITPVQAMIQSREEEIRALTQIRDSLLPKLMSGKIRVN